MAEITEVGYKLTTQNEWFEEEKQLYLDIDSEWNLDVSTPDGLKLASDAEIFANLDELGQQAFNSKDPNKATGTDLNVICALTGTVRSEGTPSNVTVTLGGVAGTVIISGKTIQSTVDDSKWTLDNAVTLDGAGTGSTTATCTENGATAASIGTITRIVDTIGGWQSVTNPAVATLGTGRQNDASLRLERAVSVARSGDNQIDNMLAEVFAVDGVRRAVVKDNATDSVDANGVPARNTYAIVDGGDDYDVAFALYSKKSTGTPWYQAATPVTETVTSEKYPSNSQEIKYSRPIYDDIVVTVTVNNGGNLPPGTDDDIAQAIVDYAAGGLLPADSGFNVLGFDIAEDVAISRIYTPVNSVIGQYAGGAYVDTITLNGGVVNIPIAFNELSRWDVSNITVQINV